MFCIFLLLSAILGPRLIEWEFRHRSMFYLRHFSLQTILLRIFPLLKHFQLSFRDRWLLHGISVPFVTLFNLLVFLNTTGYGPDAFVSWLIFVSHICCETVLLLLSFCFALVSLQTRLVLSYDVDMCIVVVILFIVVLFILLWHTDTATVDDGSLSLSLSLCVLKPNRYSQPLERDLTWFINLYRYFNLST